MEVDDELAPQSQPDPTPPASAQPAPAAEQPPPAPAATEGEAPADQGTDDAPAASGDEQPAERRKLSPETLGAVIEVAEDDIVTDPRIRARIQREAQALAAQTQREARQDFTIDVEWRRLNDAHEQAEKAYTAESEAAASLLKRFQEGDDDVEPQSVALATRQALTRSGELAQLAQLKAERREFLVVDDAADSLLGEHHEVVIAKSQTGEDITVDSAYQGAITHYHRLRNAGAQLIAQAQEMGQQIPEAQVQQIIKARQSALPTLINNVMTIAMAVAEKRGEKRATEKAAREAKALEVATEENLMRELAVNGQLAAGSTPPAPRGKPSTTPALSRDNLMAGTWRDARKVFEANGAKI